MSEFLRACVCIFGLCQVHRRNADTLASAIRAVGADMTSQADTVSRMSSEWHTGASALAHDVSALAKTLGSLRVPFPCHRPCPLYSHAPCLTPGFVYPPPSRAGVVGGGLEHASLRRGVGEPKPL